MTYSVRTADQAAASRIDEEWGSLNWLASQAIGNAKGVTVGRARIKSGHSNPRHSHHNCEEVLLVLSGLVEHTMGAATVILEPGDTLVVAADLPHGARAIGEEDADMIIAYSSGDRDFVPED